MDNHIHTKASSEIIKQNASLLPASPSVPDLHNLGTMLRLLLLVNLFAALTVLLQTGLTDAQLFDQFVLMAGQIELPLFCIIVILYIVYPWLAHQSRLKASFFIHIITLFIAALIWLLLRESIALPSIADWLAWTTGATLLSLFYFDYRNHLYSPAKTEARLLALTARIRPHFLFNSLNGVLGIIRSDPQRAERALEELADLFRALIQDNRELVTLDEEITLCKRYIDLELLRLGERLDVQWEEEPPPSNFRLPELGQVRVPPLLLQPLVENAIYHGIEPASKPGRITIRIWTRNNLLHIEVKNPVTSQPSHHIGNHMALNNIRERLTLFFDFEAGLEIDTNQAYYRVQIHLPIKPSRHEKTATHFNR